ncbi:MAG: hypoxanthine phosphoribosyltransferase [Verrucomicrobiae bacterium]|nr:hypoxanthine phosphoribosyltransferase [Verrucomicrobiae bacterium]
MHSFCEDLEEVLLTEAQIQRRLDELAAQLRSDYAGRELTMVGLLTGSVLFVADLVRRLPGRLRLDFLGISSYRGETASSNRLNVTKELQLDVRDRDVLVVDDIWDTGATLARARDLIVQMGPRSLKFCVLLEKDVRLQTDVVADYVGFRIPARFVIGYGLDYQERYRNLPCIGVLKPDVLSSRAAADTRRRG